jgi:hypothetical protein
MKILSKKDGEQYPFCSLLFSVEHEGEEKDVLVTLLKSSAIFEGQSFITFWIGHEAGGKSYSLPVDEDELEKLDHDLDFFNDHIQSGEIKRKRVDAYLEQKLLEVADKPDFIKEFKANM